MQRTHIQDLSWGEALRLAIDLLAYGGNTFPDNEFFIFSVRDRVIPLLIEFAVHARRCLDETGDNPDIVGVLHKVEIPPDVILETKLRYALNGIVHAHDLDVTVGHQTVTSRYADMGDVSISHVHTVTDKQSKRYVELHALAWTFITYCNDLQKSKTQARPTTAHSEPGA